MNRKSRASAFYQALYLMWTSLQLSITDFRIRQSTAAAGALPMMGDLWLVHPCSLKRLCLKALTKDVEVKAHSLCLLPVTALLPATSATSMATPTAFTQSQSPLLTSGVCTPTIQKLVLP